MYATGFKSKEPVAQYRTSKHSYLRYVSMKHLIKELTYNVAVMFYTVTMVHTSFKDEKFCRCCYTKGIHRKHRLMYDQR